MPGKFLILIMFFTFPLHGMQKQDPFDDPNPGGVIHRDITITQSVSAQCKKFKTIKRNSSTIMHEKFKILNEKVPASALVSNAGEKQPLLKKK
jgi:hypothetical protein